jgi:hypothetical protein
MLWSRNQCSEHAKVPQDQPQRGQPLGTEDNVVAGQRKREEVVVKPSPLMENAMAWYTPGHGMRSPLDTVTFMLPLDMC